MNGMDERQSTLIKAMRFPLIVLVVWSHALGFERVTMSRELSGWNVYHFVSEMVSHNLARIAVCWFFVFSGYFFFRNLVDGQFSFRWVAGKWKSRLRSLLLPFLLWNGIFVVLTVVKSTLFGVVGLGDDGGMEWLKATGPLYWFWKGPADFPLWYMRDLLVLTLLTPLVYYLFKGLRLKGSVVFLFVMAVLLTIFNIPVSCFGFRPLVFFSLGAMLGIYKLNMLQLCQKVKWPAAVVAAVTLVLATCYNGTACHDTLQHIFYPFGMITLMNLCNRLIDNPSRCERMCDLAGSVFFIYAAHEIFILGWTKGAFLRLFGDGLLGAWMSFLFVPVVVLVVCYVLYRLLHRFTPKTLAFVCGGRVKK